MWLPFACGKKQNQKNTQKPRQASARAESGDSEVGRFRGQGQVGDRQGAVVACDTHRVTPPASGPMGFVPMPVKRKEEGMRNMVLEPVVHGTSLSEVDSSGQVKRSLENPPMAFRAFFLLKG